MHKTCRLIWAFLLCAILLQLPSYAAWTGTRPYFSNKIDRTMAMYIADEHWDKNKIENPPGKSEPWTSLYGDYRVQWVNDYQTKYLTDAIGQTGRFLWNLPAVYGSGDGSGMVSVAASQIGNAGGQPYWSYMGFSSHVPWCAAFVCWVANQNGLDETIIPKTASAGNMRGIFQGWGREYSPSGYIPEPGDLIFFIWPGNTVRTLANHVGIVEKVEGGKVHTIEGNTGGGGGYCRRRQYDLTSSSIVGYAKPDYPPAIPEVAPSPDPSATPAPMPT